MKKIFLVSTRNFEKFGGIERYIDNFTRYFKETEDWQLTVLVNRGAKNNLCQSSNVRYVFFDLPVRPYKNFFRFLNPVRQKQYVRKALSSHFEKDTADIILTRDLDAVLPLKSLTQKPVFYLPGSLLAMDLKFDFDYSGGILYRFSRWLQNRVKLHLEKKAFLAADQILAFSKRMKKNIQRQYGIDERKIMLIPMGMNIKKSDLNANHEVQRGKILVASRLSKSKNIQSVISAMPYLETFTLTVAGDGPYRGYLEQMADQLGVKNRIQFLGQVEDMRREYQTAEFFVHVSYYENFGQVLLEAMLYGKPPVVLNPRQAGVFTANDEIIQDGNNGYYVDNNPKMIASKIKELALQGQKGVIQHCRDFAAQFTFGRHLEELTEIINKDILA